MRYLWVVLGLILSIASAHADKVAVSGQPLVLFWAYSTNPDCSAFGTMVMRATQPPEHGRITIRHTGVFPNFPDSNIRNVCNRRRVAGVEATYVSQRGYLGPDFTVLEVLFPWGRVDTVRLPIQVR